MPERVHLLLSETLADALKSLGSLQRLVWPISSK
jgi:hypothetical protein